MAALAGAGWRVVLATAFTRSVPAPTGFALACQLDKGLPPDADYMALRREEDRTAAALLGAEPRWLDLPEAPHRGYGSAPALFGPVVDGDHVWRPVADAVAVLLEELRPAAVFAPQGLGNHVDHRQVIRAALHAVPPGLLGFWRDTPYVIRDPAASPAAGLPALPHATLDIAPWLDRKVAASCAYTTQVGFQFGSATACAGALRALAARDGGEGFMGRIPLEASAWA